VEFVTDVTALLLLTELAVLLTLPEVAGPPVLLMVPPTAVLVAVAPVLLAGGSLPSLQAANPRPVSRGRTEALRKLFLRMVRAISIARMVKRRGFRGEG